MKYTALPIGATVALYDLMGRLLINYNLSTAEGNLIIPTQTYPAGIYLVVVRSAVGLISQQKLVIE